MPEKEYKVLRCSSQAELKILLEEYSNNGWRPIGHTEIFEKEIIQPVYTLVNDDDTEEITLEITRNDLYE